MGSGPIRRYGLARVGVALLGRRQCATIRVGFEVSWFSSSAQCGIKASYWTPVEGSPLLLPVDQDVELSTPPPALRLPARCQASHHEDNGLNL